MSLQRSALVIVNPCENVAPVSVDCAIESRHAAMNAFAGAGEAAGVHHGHKTAQELQIQHETCPFFDYSFFHWMAV